MFNRKPESDYNAYAHQPDGVNGHATVVAPSIMTPVAHGQGPDGNYSIINEWLIMRGDLESEADILVKGKIFGNVKCKMLIIDAGAHVEGGIEADDIIVRGSTKGVIVGKKVRFEKTADVDSEIHHLSFAAEEGAKIRGALRYGDDVSGVDLNALLAKRSDATH